MSTAIVLSGGSVKGAFQAGALQVVLDAGKVPSFLSGISVGSLNALFVAYEAGRQQEEGGVDWPKAGHALTNFWTERVHGPSDLVKERSWLARGWAAITSHWEGLVDTTPLRKLIESTITEPRWLQQSPVELSVGLVDYYRSTISYFGKSDPEILDAVVGSAAIPAVMPAATVKGAVCFDGGLRDVAPLRPAMKANPDEVVVIACQPENARQYPVGDPRIDHRNLIKLLEHMTDIMVSEIVNDDIQLARLTNQLIEQGLGQGVEFLQNKHHRPLTVIRPAEEIPVDITNFDESGIAQMLELGRSRAREALGL